MSTLFGLDLAGKKVLVVGGGRVASRRIRRFVAAGAKVLVVALDVVDDIERSSFHGDLEWLPRSVEPQDLDDAWLVLAATDQAKINERIAGWAHERHIWCIDASDASRGSARQAAMSAHGDVSIGVISSYSPDPGRIRSVRDALAQYIDDGHVDLRPKRRTGEGKVILVGSGPGDPGLITVRGKQALAQADVVITDRLGATSLLSNLPYEVDVINVGKSPDTHPVPQSEINALIVEHARAGKLVVRLKGGDPYVFGRGGEEVNACLKAGLSVEVVPGITSAFAVPARAGIPVTQRAVATSVLVTTGHQGADSAALAALSEGATVVVLMGVAALPAITTAALDFGISPQLPVAIVEQGTTTQERTTRGTLQTIVEVSNAVGVKPPAIIVIGEVSAAEFLLSNAAQTTAQGSAGE